MRRFVLYLVCGALAFLLVTPAAASATTPTLAQLAQEVATLQTQMAQQQALNTVQASQIQTLQTQVAAKHAILSGTGAPTAMTGAIGDFYLNTTTYLLYGPKTVPSSSNSTGWVQGPRSSAPRERPGPPAQLVRPARPARPAPPGRLARRVRRVPRATPGRPARRDPPAPRATQAQRATPARPAPPGRPARRVPTARPGTPAPT